MKKLLEKIKMRLLVKDMKLYEKYDIQFQEARQNDDRNKMREIYERQCKLIDSMRKHNKALL